MKLRHALIGCGHTASNHADACKYNNVEIVNCFDVDKQKAQKFAKKHNIKSVASSLEEILEDGQIHTVSVCISHKGRTEITIKSLEANKCVVAERPIDLSAEKAAKMTDTAKRNNKILSIVPRSGAKHHDQLGDFFHVATGKSKELIIKPKEVLNTI